MNSKKIGMIFSKDTRTKNWWIKLGAALVLSNVFFFILFSGDSEVKQDFSIPPGWVEVQVSAELMTPFHSGKKVLIVHRLGRKKLEGVLQTNSSDLAGRITVLVKEDEAHALFQHEAWEVLPFLKDLKFVSVNKRDNHEIRY